jgi:signal peptidase I
VHFRSKSDKEQPLEDQFPEYPQRRRARNRHEALSFISIILVAFLLAWGIIAFVFESYQVDGVSMQSTLQNKDRLIVWKVPRTWSKITGNPYIPDRGDIIIFNQPGLGRYGDPSAEQLVKRTIGLPGDHIVIKNGLVYIYNKQQPNGFVPKETYAFGKNIPYTSGNIDITLGPHQLFMMGDNRPDSLDSRVFGPINASQIIGKLVLRDWPINAIKAF